jgi:hypothetical protein
VANRLVEDLYVSRLIVADRGFDDVCGGDGRTTVGYLTNDTLEATVFPAGF